MWWGSKIFSSGSKIVGYRLPDGVRGASINAIGSSLPEFFIALLFFIILNEGSNGMAAALASIVGSAIFNILIIPSIVIGILIIKKQKLKIKKHTIIRDSIILLLVQIILLYSLNDYKITQIEGLVLVLIYLGYIAILFLGKKWKEKDPKIKKEHLITGWKKLLIGCLIASLGCWICVHVCEMISKSEWLFEIGNFQKKLPGLNTSITITALCIAAAASSVPDLFISIIDAKDGEIDDAISNPLGSNIFELCVAFSVPLVLYIFLNQEITFTNASQINELQQFIQLMISITILFLLSTSLWFIKKFQWAHVVFFIILFLGFLWCVFDPEILKSLLFL